MNQKVDIASLVFFRICFGLLAATEAMGLWTFYHFTLDLYNPDVYHVPYIGFEWVKPLPDPWISMVFAVTFLGGVGVMLGWRYRLSALLGFLGHTYFFLVDKTHYLNHGYLLCWLSFVILFLPLHRSFSLDVISGKTQPAQKVSFAYLFIPAFLMGAVYFFGGIAKINGDWLRGIPLSTWLGHEADMPLLGSLWGQEWMGLIFAWGGMLLDLLAIPLLLFRHTRKWTLVFIVLFHICNGILFSIGIFPFLSLALTSLYFPSSWPRKLISFAQGKWKCVFRWAQHYRKKTDSAKIIVPRVSPTGQWAIALLVIIHIGLPLRHHLFPGNVNWTEEGHKYSWRMMLRQKSGSGVFIAKNKETGKRKHYKANDIVPNEAAREIYGHPDMIWQIAQRIKYLHHLEGKEEVQVFCCQNAVLNYKKSHLLIDPEVNIAAENWHFFKHSDWILSYR